MTENSFSRNFQVWFPIMQSWSFNLRIIFQEILQLCCLLSNICKNRRIFLLDFSSIQSFWNWLKNVKRCNFQKSNFSKKYSKFHPENCYCWESFDGAKISQTSTVNSKLSLFFDQITKEEHIQNVKNKHLNYISVEKSSDEISRFKSQSEWIIKLRFVLPKTL